VPSQAEADHQDAVERELLALRLAQNPAAPLRNASEVRHAAALGWSLDVNRATAADWQRLPGCGHGQVDLLLRLQRGGVQLSGPEDLGAVLQLDGATLDCWLPLLRFRWYGEPPPLTAGPVAVNQASARELAALPELSPDRSSRLLRERARGPFRDLADLRDRLGLPPAVAEQWIGRVSFAPGRPGPDLPLGAAAAPDPAGGLSLPGRAAAPGPSGTSTLNSGSVAAGPLTPGASPSDSGSATGAAGPAATKGAAGPSLPPSGRNTGRPNP
jgi:DNA uptake protein ComE-like DNA-binding protein